MTILSPKLTQVYLTDREVEVLQLLASGLCAKEAGAVLHISVKTVEKHRNSAQIKLGIRGPANVAHFALARGLIKNKYSTEPTQ